MARIVPAATVLLLLTLGLGGGRGPRLAAACAAPGDIVLEKDDEKVIMKSSEKKPSGELILLNMYVLPGSDFKGVKLSASGTHSAGAQQTLLSWDGFTTDCFNSNGRWWQMLAWAKKNDTHLSLGYGTGDCLVTCATENNRHIQSVSVEAQGSSRWRTASPNCALPQALTASPSVSALQSCKAPPLPTAATLSSFGGDTSVAVTAAAAVTLVVLVLVVVVVVVAVVCRKRRFNDKGSQEAVWRPEPEPEPEPTEGASQAHGRENSLYQPFENYMSAAATGGSTVTEENALYEPFENYMNVTGPSGHEGSLRVSENSLYESFDNSENKERA